MRDSLVKVELKGQDFLAPKSASYLLKFLRLSGRDVGSVSELINDVQVMLDAFDSLKKAKEDPTASSGYFERFRLFHTIKPNTQYAHQQATRDGKKVLYPIYSIDNEKVYSSASGGNYPIDECIIYAKHGNDIVRIN